MIAGGNLRTQSGWSGNQHQGCVLVFTGVVLLSKRVISDDQNYFILPNYSNINWKGSFVTLLLLQLFLPCGTSGHLETVHNLDVHIQSIGPIFDTGLSVSYLSDGV